MNTSPHTNTASRWPKVVWLLVSQVIGLFPLIPWLIVAPFSLMAFDGGASNEAMTWVGVIWCYPVLPVGASLIAWVLFVFKKDRAALIVTSLPLLVAVPLLGFIGYLWLAGIGK